MGLLNGNFARYGGFGILGRMAWEKQDANKSLQDLLLQDPTYTKSPYAAQQLGMAQQLANGRMPGAGALENNIFTNQANFQGNVDRNSSDASQALSLASAGQQQTNDAFSNLETKEGDWKKFGLQNLNEAYGVNIAEDDKVYGDKVRRFGDMAQIKGAESANKQAASKTLLNLFSSFASLGMGGGFGGKGKGG